MKKILLFIVIFGLGALFYAFVARMIDTPKVAEETPTEEATTTITVTTSLDDEEEVALEETPVVITPDGSLLDGPFVVFTSDGKETDATVRLVRSPEERLLQFENWNEPYAAASHVYFASDKKATEKFDLGPAHMNDDYLIYGIPLDADLGAYNYILIYQTQTGQIEYYARIQ